LDDWLEQLYDSEEGGPESPQYKEAARAVQMIGTNAFPHLLELMEKSDSQFRRKLVKFAPECLKMRQVSYQHMIGAYGFIAMGSAARPVIPSLVALAGNSDPEIRYSAIVALSHIDCAPQQIVPLLIAHLDDVRVQAEAAEGLGRLHQEPCGSPDLVDKEGEAGER
jgi:HEAT repeat protein